MVGATIGPPKFVARVNLKPLSPTDALPQLNPEKVLKKVRKEILKRIRDRIMLGAFSPAAKKALTTGLKTKLGPRSVTLIATHPAFMPLIKGQKAGQMRWLRKSPTPIPIVLDSGKVIFRTASAKSMESGRWMHPGHAPTGIVEMAREEARTVVRKQLKKELLKQLRKGLSK